MMRPNLTNPLKVSDPRALTTGSAGVLTEEPGSVVALGDYVYFETRRNTEAYGYTDSAGEVIERTLNGSGRLNYSPASGDLLIDHPALMGPQVWLCVYNGSGADIEQGDAVVFDTTVPSGFTRGQAFVRSCTAADGAAKVKGFAQYKIPNGKYAFVLAKGVGLVLGAGALSDGDLLIPAASGQVTVAASIVNASCAELLETIGSAGLAQAEIRCW